MTHIACPRVVAIAPFIALVTALMLAAFPASEGADAHEDGIDVESTDDRPDAQPGDGICEDGSGFCTLRAAVMEANARPGPDEVSLPAGTYPLTLAGAGEDAAATGDLDVTDSLTITGAGNQTTVIDAGGIDRVLHVSGSATELNISGTTLTGGNLEPPFEPSSLCFPLHHGGGGICVAGGHLNLSDAEVRGNHSDDHGGGILIGLSANLTLLSANLHENSSLRSGGGFSNFGTATVRDSSISGNTAPAGGGIRNTGEILGTSGLLVIEDSTIENNRSSIGGGVDNGFGGDLTVAGSLIAGNESETGGGIYSSGGIPDLGAHTARFTLRDSAVRGNSAGIGGGVYNASAATRSVATIERVTVSDNTARTIAGGIFNAGDLSLTASTVSGNTAVSRGGGLVNAGAINVPGVFGRATLTNSTISGNTAGESGGGIRNVGSLSSTNVTIAHNSAQDGGNLTRNGFDDISLLNTLIGDALTGGDCGAGPPPLSLGHNLDSDGTCGLTGPGDIPNAEPKLGPLADNGGPTRTHALIAGGCSGDACIASSPAIDAGDNVACPPIDQRGIARPFDWNSDGSAVCDIGAFEQHDPPINTCAGSCPPSPPTPSPSPPPPASPSPAPVAVLPVAFPRTGGDAGPGSGIPLSFGVISALVTVAALLRAFARQ